MHLAFLLITPPGHAFGCELNTGLICHHCILPCSPHMLCFFLLPM